MKHACKRCNIIQVSDVLLTICLIFIRNFTAVFLIQQDGEPATEVEYERAKTKQYIRNVCAALKAYFDAHVVLLADLVRNSGVDLQGEMLAGLNGPSHSGGAAGASGGPAQPRLLGAPSCGRRTPSMSPAYNTVTELPAHKAMPSDAQFVSECLDLLLQTLPSRLSWRPMDEFTRLGGIPLLVQLLRIASGWSVSTMRTESVRAALDALAVCALMPENSAVRFSVHLRYGSETTNGIAELVNMLDAPAEEGDVLRAVLNVIVMCVCPPAERVSPSRPRNHLTSSFHCSHRVCTSL